MDSKEIETVRDCRAEVFVLVNRMMQRETVIFELGKESIKVDIFWYLFSYQSVN